MLKEREFNIPLTPTSSLVVTANYFALIFWFVWAAMTIHLLIKVFG